MSERYILENGNPVPCDSLMEWGQWMETADRHVALTEYPNGVTISTVFLGLDHSFGGKVPVLFESMIFGGPLDGEQKRYTNREDAVRGHQALIAQVEQGSPRQHAEGGTA